MSICLLSMCLTNKYASSFHMKLFKMDRSDSHSILHLYTYTYNLIEQKCMNMDKVFCYFSILSPSLFFSSRSRDLVMQGFSSLPFFWGGKIKGEMNNQSRDQKSFLSARSYNLKNAFSSLWFSICTHRPVKL